jgi:mRNA-degrading endonuclease RelE of RelBE toxin-antitoxin system
MLSTHVGNWVIIYMVEGEVIVLLNFDHHDHAYRRL